MTSPPPLLFGIYPLGVAGTPTGLAVGPPDDYDQIRAALNDLGLQGSTRTYLVSTETGGEDAVLRLADRCRPSTWTYVVGTAKSLLGASPHPGSKLLRDKRGFYQGTSPGVGLPSLPGVAWMAPPYKHGYPWKHIYSHDV